MVAEVVRLVTFVDTSQLRRATTEFRGLGSAAIAAGDDIDRATGRMQRSVDRVDFSKLKDRLKNAVNDNLQGMTGGIGLDSAFLGVGEAGSAAFAGVSATATASLGSLVPLAARVAAAMKVAADDMRDYWHSAIISVAEDFNFLANHADAVWAKMAKQAAAIRKQQEAPRQASLVAMTGYDSLGEVTATAEPGAIRGPREVGNFARTVKGMSVEAAKGLRDLSAQMGMEFQDIAGILRDAENQAKATGKAIRELPDQRAARSTAPTAPAAPVTPVRGAQLDLFKQTRDPGLNLIQKAAADATMAFGALDRGATAAMDRVRSGVGTAKTAIAGLATGTNAVVSSFLNLKTLLGGMAIGAFVGAWARITDAYALTEARIRLYVDQSKSAEKQNNIVSATMDRLYSAAQRSQQPFQDLAGIYTKVASVGKDLNLNTEEQLAVTQALSDAARISGSSASEAANGMQQLGQALAGGVLRGEEFNSVMENTPRVARAIAAGMGVTIGELRNLAAEGKLTARQVIDAVISQTSTLASEASKMPDTVGGALTQVQNAFGKTVTEIDKSEGAGRRLKDTLKNVANQIETPAFAEGLAIMARGLARVAEMAGNAIIRLGEFGKMVQEGDWVGIGVKLWNALLPEEIVVAKKAKAARDLAAENAKIAEQYKSTPIPTGSPGFAGNLNPRAAQDLGMDQALIRSAPPPFKPDANQAKILKDTAQQAKDMDRLTAARRKGEAAGKAMENQLAREKALRESLLPTTSEEYKALERNLRAIEGNKNAQDALSAAKSSAASTTDTIGAAAAEAAAQQKVAAAVRDVADAYGISFEAGQKAELGLEAKKNQIDIEKQLADAARGEDGLRGAALDKLRQQLVLQQQGVQAEEDANRLLEHRKQISGLDFEIAQKQQSLAAEQLIIDAIGKGNDLEFEAGQKAAAITRELAVQQGLRQSLYAAGTAEYQQLEARLRAQSALTAKEDEQARVRKGKEINTGLDQEIRDRERLLDATGRGEDAVRRLTAAMADEKALRESGLPTWSAEYQQMEANLQKRREIDEQIRASGDSGLGAKARIYEDYYKSITNYAQQSADIVVGAMSDMTAASSKSLADMVMTGKFSMDDFKEAARDMASSVIQQLIRMAIQAAIVGPIMRALGLPGVPTGAANGAVVQRAAMGAIITPAVQHVERVFSEVPAVPDTVQRVTRMAAGGAMIDRTTNFPTKSGVTQAGEAGPEAIFPLRRGVTGRLGIEMPGGGGGDNNVYNFNTTINAAPGQSEQDTGKMAQQWQREADAWLDGRLAQHQRVRGRLNRGTISG